jgi:hypothetical protein
MLKEQKIARSGGVYKAVFLHDSAKASCIHATDGSVVWRLDGVDLKS